MFEMQRNTRKKNYLKIENGKKTKFRQCAREVFAVADVNATTGWHNDFVTLIC